MYRMPVRYLWLPKMRRKPETLLRHSFQKERAKLIEDTKAKLSLDDLFSQIQAGKCKGTADYRKADVQGPWRLKQSLTTLSNEEVMVKVIHGGVGAINESDVSGICVHAIIIGFNIRPDATASPLQSVKRWYPSALLILSGHRGCGSSHEGHADPVFEEKVIGHAVIRQTFKRSGIGTIAGSYVLDGKFQEKPQLPCQERGRADFEGPGLL